MSMFVFKALQSRLKPTTRLWVWKATVLTSVLDRKMLRDKSTMQLQNAGLSTDTPGKLQKTRSLSALSFTKAAVMSCSTCFLVHSWYSLHLFTLLTLHCLPWQYLAVALSVPGPAVPCFVPGGSTSWKDPPEQGQRARLSKAEQGLDCD